MGRGFINCVNRFLCWISRNRIIKTRVRPVKVNIGSSLHVARGWLNIDASPHILVCMYPKFILKIAYEKSEVKTYIPNMTYERYCDILRNNTFIHHNVEYGLPFPEESVDYIYTSHFFEHLFREDAEKLAAEAYRVLKRGGLIRICVPDLEYFVSLYLKGDKEEALNNFYLPSKAMYFNQHRYMYDFDLLKRLLEKAGFAQIEKCQYRKGGIPDVEVLDNRPGVTLHVEACKG